MDIIDVMLARALTPQGQVETYAAKAQKAAQDASAAAASATNAAQALEDAAQTKADAEAALNDVQAALEALDGASANIDAALVDTEIKKLTLSRSQVTNNSNEYYENLHVHYPDGSEAVIPNTVSLKKSTGTSEVSGMTQKAITEALASKADSSTVATKVYVDEAIANIPSSGSGSGPAVIDLGSNNDGKIVIIDSNGNIISGSITEDEIIEALIISGGYTVQNALGLEVDYNNKSMARTQLAIGKNMGSDFDIYTMYGGRRRCNVADNGTINAFYGEAGYTEDGSNGQVMVYQPKFYYQRMPLSATTNKIGKIIEKDSFMISTSSQPGFKLHPIFKADNGEELDYVLFSAYEGGLYDTSENTYLDSVASNVDFSNDKLTSISGTKPLTGTSSLSLEHAEQLAKNRGTGWHIYNMAAESANQMLEIIEFGTMNGQSALGRGVCDLAVQGNYNQSAITGSTSSLGNTSGAAASTIIEVNGTRTTQTTNGKVSISYRGVENPWGNVWNMIGGITLRGDSNSNGGVPYICKNYNYTYNAIGNNYESVDFSLPNGNNWVSALGYGNKTYDWVLMPADCASSANSILPIGDNGWFDANLSGIRMVLQGGSWSFAESDGIFYYGCDRAPNDSSYKSYGARLMFIPTKNEIYTSNIAKWQAEMNIGG